ncbi:MAG: NADH-quinone oxidoreductase subunit J, partial [Oscillochloris sp.]|nr:NADH-quinone oxidoreductase subunit J [Oscillochloris sp.]
DLGAGAMLITRNAVHSALFLLLNFGAMAVLFLLLQSPFLFTIQLTVYAGAIMVLFLFVMMLLGAERVEDHVDRIAWVRPLALLLGLGLLAVAGVVAARNFAASTADMVSSPSFGEPAELGKLLFTSYLLPFEITGVILLVGVIGVVVFNQRGRRA